MTDRYDLRPATADDADDLGRMQQTWLDETPCMPDLHTLDGTRKHLARVIREQRVLVDTDRRGYVAVDGDESDTLTVDAPARGQGLGQALMAAAMADADALDLWCFQANDGARWFYHRLGFREIPRTDGQGNYEKLPDIRMRWQRHG